MADDDTALVVSVGDMSFDVRVPTHSPVGGWMPELIALLREHGVLSRIDHELGSGLRRDATTWFRRDGRRVDPSRSAAEQGMAGGTEIWWGRPPSGEVRIAGLVDAPPVSSADRGIAIVSASVHALLSGVQISVGLHGALSPGGTVGADLAPSWTGSLSGIAAGLWILQIALLVALGLRMAPRTPLASAAWVVSGLAATLAGIAVALPIALRSGPHWPLAVAVPVATVAVVLTSFTRRQGALGAGLLVMGALLCLTGALTFVPTVTTDIGFAAAMLGAVVVASTSHRVAAMLTDPSVTSTTSATEGEGDHGPVAVAGAVIDAPRLRLSQARDVQSAIVASCAAFVVLGGLANEADALALTYDVVCLFAMLRLLAIAASPAQPLLIPAIAAGSGFLAIAARPDATVVVAAIACVVAVYGLLPPRSGAGERAADVVFARSRLPVLLAAFGLFVAEVDGWGMAWDAGVRLGEAVR